MHFALMRNKKNKSGKVFTRCGNPFEVISVDNSKKFIKISKERVKKYSKHYQKVKFNFSEAKMTKFNFRYTTEYAKHPIVNLILFILMVQASGLSRIKWTILL